MDGMDLTPIILAIIGSGSLVVSIAVVVIQHRLQKLQLLEEKLRDERRKVYLDVLRPLILCFKKGTTEDEFTSLLNDIEYRKSTVDLSLIGSDDVVRAWGDLMQHFYTTKNIPKEQSDMKNVKLVAKLLLTIRKDFNRNKTQLDAYDMLRHMLTDLYRFSRSDINS
jgi:hypothetical protein